MTTFWTTPKLLHCILHLCALLILILQLCYLSFIDWNNLWCIRVWSSETINSKFRARTLGISGCFKWDINWSSRRALFLITLRYSCRFFEFILSLYLEMALSCLVIACFFCASVRFSSSTPLLLLVTLSKGMALLAVLPFSLSFPIIINEDKMRVRI